MAFLTNLYLSEYFTPIVQATYVNNSYLASSGAVSVNKNSYPGGGIYKSRRFMKMLTGDFEVPTINTALSANSPTMGEDLTIVFERAYDIYFTLSQFESLGINPATLEISAEKLDELIQLTKRKVAEQVDKAGYNVLKGVFATALTDYSYKADPVALPNLDAWYKAKRKIGLSSETLKYCFIHPNVRDAAEDAGLVANGVTFTSMQDAMNPGNIQMINNIPLYPTNLTNVSTDDSPVYDTFLIAPGAIEFDNPYMLTKITEYGNYGGVPFHLTIHMKMSWHVPGVSYTLGTAEPTDANLSTGSSYTKVAENKEDIGIVRIQTLGNA